MIRFSTGKTVENATVSVQTETLAGFRRSVATIHISDMTYAKAAELFVDGAVWSIVDGDEVYDSWNDYTKAGPITDNRDGSVTVKMGMADTAEQIAQREADQAMQRVSMIAGTAISNDDDAIAIRTQIEALFTSSALDDDCKISSRTLAPVWKPGYHEVGENYTANEQVWECYQQYDNEVYPSIKPGDSSWFIFNRPLHGKTPETAMPFVPVQGSHDIYRTGEYMIYTDGKTYKCKSNTNFSPEEYPNAWEVYNG